MSSDPRQLLFKLFQQGLAAVNGRSCVHAALRELTLPDNLYLVAVGKAADSMAAGAIDAVGGRLRAGLVITRYGHQDSPVYRDPRIVSLEAGHPLPDEQSIAAGNALRLFLEHAPADAHFVFLISGGASSLAEVPAEGISLANLRMLTRWLLGSGLPIDSVNRVRSAFSVIKGGRLLRDLGNRHAELLLISDVPDNIPAHIGSGMLLLPVPGSFPDLPAKFAALPRQPAPELRAGNVSVRTLATNQQALQAVLAAALSMGETTKLHTTLLQSDAAACGVSTAEFLMQAGAGVHIWGGETLVRLPPRPGRGGRNQMLALAAAQRMQGHRGLYLLAAGTDGTDGNSMDAGALVDGATLDRGREAGLDPGSHLAGADAGTFLEAAGDLVYTGPTGTNVMDIVIGYRMA